MKANNSSGTHGFCFSILCSGAVAVGLSLNANAQINMNGTLGAGYGSPLAVQTINTDWGDSTFTGSDNGPDANGSELDAAYGVISGANLDLFLAGDFQNNGNHVNIFIADGRAGQSTLNASVGPINQMNGSVFSPGFGNGATLALDFNDYYGTVYVDSADLVNPGNSGYQGAVGLNSGIGSGTLYDGIFAALNNSHISTMGAGSAALSGATSGANTTTGLELSIPLSLLGNPSGSIEVLADINGGGDGYLSQQFLPGLPVSTGDLGGPGTFNFGSTDEYFTVAPEPGTITLLGLSLAGWLSSRRRK
jgi:hypothetical protein